MNLNLYKVSNQKAHVQVDSGFLTLLKPGLCHEYGLTFVYSLGRKLTSTNYLRSFAKMTFLQRIFGERDQNKVAHSQYQNIMPLNAFWIKKNLVS